MAPPKERLDVPGDPVDVTPEDFEREVMRWLELSASRGTECQFQHQGVVSGSGGEYAIDILVSLELFDGAALTILVECKHQRRRVERDEILILEGKLRDVGAHKGMLFATPGFQEGAIKYAAAHGIATITFIDGRSLYMTKAVGPTPEPPPWAGLPRFAGVRVSPLERGIRCETVYDGSLEALVDWIGGRPPAQSTTE